MHQAFGVAPPATDLCNLITAQWRARPDDQRFLSLEDLHAHCSARAERSETTITKARRIRPEAMPLMPNQAEPEYGADDVDRHLGLVFETEAGMVDATHWSFGQVASITKTPVPYLRRIDTRLAAKLIDYGLTFLAGRDDHALLTERVRGRGDLASLRAITSPSFGRIYDHEVVQMVADVADPDIWKPPAHRYSGEAGTRKATTLYASDRDVTIFLVDDRNPIEIRVNGDTEVLARGFMVRNSEVGLTRFRVSTFFYRYTCDNRLLWTPRSIQEIGITHTAGAPERFRLQAAPMLARFAQADVTEVRDRVERAMRLEAGRDDQSVTDWLVKNARMGTTEAKTVIAAARREEGRARTVWDLIQGGTAAAREIGHVDQRIEKEARFGRFLDLV